MKQGFVKVAAVTPDIRVADVEFNKEQICRKMDEAAASGAKIIVFPELCVTGYTCSDLFTQDVLLDHAREVLTEIGSAYQRYGCAGICGRTAGSRWGTV